MQNQNVSPNSRLGRSVISVAFVLIFLVAASGSGRMCSAEETAEEITRTWADSHPELVSMFGYPFSAEGRTLRARFPRWPVELFKASHAASQPTLVLGKNNELIIHLWSGVGNSTDGGRTWQMLGSPPRAVNIPKGFKHMKTSLDGCGVTDTGTIVVHYATQYNDGRKYEGFSDPTFHTDLYVARSTDHGKSWDTPIRLNVAPTENAGAHRTRFFRLKKGVIALAMGVWNQSTDGKPLAYSERHEKTYIWSSADDGKTWTQSQKPICEHGAEPDILLLPSGRLLAAVRYQRHKLPSDIPELASPHRMRKDKPPYRNSKKLGLGLVSRNTAVLHSDDGGLTWSAPRMVTGFDEQTGCLIRLPNGAVVLVFGHKTDGGGQRFMLSYDEGETWSRTVYQLTSNGLYASSVVLDDGTIVSVFHRIINRVGTLHSIRWKAPEYKEVAKRGFFKPRLAEPLGRLPDADQKK